MRSEVGIPFKGETKPEGNIKIKKIPAQEALHTMHKGPYKEVGPAYAALFQHANEKGYILQGCPMEIYLNDPAKVKESELLTDTTNNKETMNGNIILFSAGREMLTPQSVRILQVC